MAESHKRGEPKDLSMLVTLVTVTCFVAFMTLALFWLGVESEK